MHLLFITCSFIFDGVISIGISMYVIYISSMLYDAQTRSPSSCQNISVPRYV